jgi:hypothetical protein
MDGWMEWYTERLLAFYRWTNIYIHTYQKQEIFGLQVPMRHVMLVTVLHGLKQNLGHVPGLLFVVVALLHNPIKQFPAHHLFRHEVVKLLFLKDVVETNNVGVFDFLQYRNLILEGNLVFFRQLGFGDNLNGEGIARLLVRTLLDHGKCTGTELVWII